MSTDKQYTLGEIFVDSIEGEECKKVTVVAIKNTTGEYDILPNYLNETELLDFLYSEEPSVVFFVESDYHEDYIQDIDDALEDDEREVISLKEYEEKLTAEKKIVELLKSNKLDINNLIVSDGRVYQGYDECAGYIQATYAWCSSSMSC